MNHKVECYLALILFALPLFFAGCAKEKPIEDMTLQDMKVKATAYLKKHDYENAAKFLQLVVTKFPDDPKIGNYKISLANAKFNNKEYESAYQLYENFHQYYPSDKRAEYAKYKAAMCKFKQALTFDRDQTATNLAARVCKSYQDIATYQKYRSEIAAMLAKCQQQELDKELSICKFYIKHNKFQAAAKRLEVARKNLGKQDKELDAQLLYLECKLAAKQADQQAVKDKLSSLSNLYPSSPFTQMAQRLVKEPVTFVF
jgi:outer membrane protein assembly factor BamD